MRPARIGRRRTRRDVRSFRLCATFCLAFAAGTASAQFPDLVVNSITVQPLAPAVGQSAVVTVGIRNDGNSLPLNTFYLSVVYDTNETEYVECEIFDAGLLIEDTIPSGGQSVRYYDFEVAYNTPGIKRFFAHVDSCNAIPEWNENNNTLTRDINVGLPDLTIESIAPAVADPVPGQPFNVNVTVRNAGPAVLGVYNVGFKRGPEPEACLFDQSLNRQNFPPNSTHTFTFGPIQYAQPGTYPVCAWIDCDDNIPESNDINNKLCTSLTIGQPDLVVDSVSASDATPNPNQSVDVEVVVRNIGSANAGPFRISLVPNASEPPTGDGCGLANFQNVNAGLDVGDTVTVTIPIAYGDTGVYRMWAWADSCDAAVTEAREDNNALSQEIIVGNSNIRLPDLIVESITPSNPAPVRDEVVIYDVVVRNVGGVGAGAFRVGDFEPINWPGPYPVSYVVYNGPPSGGGGVVVADAWNDCSVRARDVGGLNAGATTAVQFWVRYTQPGEYELVATADACGGGPDFAVAESAENNNTLRIRIAVSDCTSDADRDGICDDIDVCPNIANPDQNDSDGDGQGDACDADDDNDGALDVDDCEPRNPFVHPGALDCPDGIDNNCDGQIDEDARDWFRDADGDGYGNPADSVFDCTPPAGFIADGSDCDDADPGTYPGANGPCDDGRDNDCDGVIDNERPVWGRDADGDGFTDPNDQIVDDDGVCDGQPAGYVLASPRPDPDDNDFMNPEPVRVDPEQVEISTPQGGVHSATLTLSRNGPEPYTFDIAVQYGNDASDWLLLDPPAGSAENGSAEVLVTPDVARLELAAYTALIIVTVNGSVTFEVPVSVLVRNPILRVVHTGTAPGGGAFEWDYYDNVLGQSSQLVYFVLGPGDVYEAEVPYLEGAFLYYVSSDECVIFNGLYDEAQNRLQFHEAPDDERVGPIFMDRDRTITADFQPDYLACGTCSILMLTVCCVGMRLTGPARALRRR